MIHIVSLALITGLVFLLPSSSAGQYIFLDSNGDGLSTEADRLSLAGETYVEVWLVTNETGEGTPSACSFGEAALTINSYEFILHAAGGTVVWSPYENEQPTMLTSFGVSSNAEEFYVGFGGGSVLPPGKYNLGHLTIQVSSGSPSIAFASSSVLGGSFNTSFGSNCQGQDGDNTMRLGTDWQDSDGLGAPISLGFTLSIEGAGGPEVVAASCFAGSSQTCSFTARPSNFNQECPGICIPVNRPVTFNCTFSFLCQNTGQLARGKPINVAIYPKQLTGGHCHADPSRPTTTPAVQSGMTDENGIWQFDVVAPQVSGVLNMVFYSDDPTCPFNTGRDTVRTLCVRVPDLQPIQPDASYAIFPGNPPENSERHPKFQYGQVGLLADIKFMAQDFRKLFPHLPKFEINDISLEWGGVMDAHIIGGACPAPRPPYGSYPNWIAPHCGHREGIEVDVRLKNFPSTYWNMVYEWTKGWQLIPEPPVGQHGPMQRHRFTKVGLHSKNHLHLKWR